MLDDQNAAIEEITVAIGSDVDSATLARLIEEVRTTSVEPTAYNRQHNRHNRT